MRLPVSIAFCFRDACSDSSSLQVVALTTNSRCFTSLAQLRVFSSLHCLVGATACAIVMPSASVVIFVPGLPGWGPSSDYWGQGTAPGTAKFGLNIRESAVGAISSHHDRACEVFAQILGRVVDYGEQHATEFDHQRFGADHSGKALHATWSEEKPVHLICHSAGINTGRYLQFLLATDHWNLGTNSRWIRSIVSLAGNINGTTLPYLFGVDEETGDMPKAKWVESCNRLRHATRWTAKKKKLDHEAERVKVMDWALDHWGVPSIEENVMENIAESKMFSNTDHILYETTLQGSRALNQKVSDYEGTYYFSFTALCTDLSKSSPISWMTNPLFMMPSGYMLYKKFEHSPIPEWENAPKWRENDGFLTRASQAMPFGSIDGGQFKMGCELRTGVWYSALLQDLMGTEFTWDHIDVCWGVHFLKPERMQHEPQVQTRLYELLYETLSKL